MGLFGAFILLYSLIVSGMTRDISADSAFVQLQNLQRHIELAKQVKDLCSKSNPTNPNSTPPLQGFDKARGNISIVDLDNPIYAKSILENDNYVPSKTVKVSMP